MRGILNGLTALVSAYGLYLGMSVLILGGRTYDGKPTFGIAFMLLYWALFCLVFSWKSARSRWEIVIPFALYGFLAANLAGLVLLLVALGAALAPTWKIRKLTGQQSGWWDPRMNTDDENLRWSWLRAVEWCGWPTFLTIPLVPVLLLYCRWWKVLVSVVVANVLWSVIRYRFISPTFAYTAVYLNLLKWPAALGMTVYFAVNGRLALAGLSLTWPLLAGAFAAFPPHQTEKMQSLFMERLGYERRDPPITTA